LVSFYERVGDKKPIPETEEEVASVVSKPVEPVRITKRRRKTANNSPKATPWRREIRGG